ncbi:MAG TPA: DUF1566 domain-containing protein [Candidatus Sulfotelmatobacter sp.]|nr:DUF1566 domain-containing protein [Candidatus Sulfotelmatobacter sp.]
MSSVRSLAALVALAVLTGCGGVSRNEGGNYNSPPAPDRISGRVTFKGAPVAGATLTDFLTNSNIVFKTTTTDANGEYTFTGMSVTGDVPGDYQIYVFKDGYGFYPSVGSGATVKRADYTGQFVSTGVAPSGIFFNVIDFIALPDSSVTGADFAAYDGTNPTVTLAATGQQVSYAAGDDASAGKGAAWSAATRFTSNPDGTVTDTLTGLIWLKDAGCLGSGPWQDAFTEVNQLASGACGLSDGSAAGGWRLPNINELESLVDASAANPAISVGNPFVNVSGGIYWSSTSYYGGVGGSDKAWTIRMSDGRYMNDTASNVKASASNAIWAVKGAGTGGAVQLQSTGFYIPYSAGDDGSVQAGVPQIYPRFIDNHDGTIVDTMTGLVWLKQADCIHATWADALMVISSLGAGQCGLNDGSTAGQWRMPNRNELESLADRAQTNMAQFFDYTYVNKDGSTFQAPIFTNYVETEYYWTSTTDAVNPTQAWTVYSCDFGVYEISKSAVGFAVGVRSKW